MPRTPPRFGMETRPDIARGIITRGVLGLSRCCWLGICTAKACAFSFSDDIDESCNLYAVRRRQRSSRPSVTLNSRCAATSVGALGTVSLMQSRTQSPTRSFAVAHMHAVIRVYDELS